MPLLPMVKSSLRVVSRMSTLLLNRVMGTLDMVCHSFTSKSYFPFSLLLSSSLPAYLGTTKDMSSYTPQVAISLLLLRPHLRLAVPHLPLYVLSILLFPPLHMLSSRRRGLG
jgi:hypothetical protein